MMVKLLIIIHGKGENGETLGESRFIVLNKV